MAETFLSEGAQVAICDVDEAALADFSAAHPDAIAIRASVAKPQQVESFFDQVETAFGGLEVVCANAGTGGPAAAKWAVVGMTKTLAMELGPHGVRVNSVCPGAVEGERMDQVISVDGHTETLAP